MMNLCLHEFLFMFLSCHQLREVFLRVWMLFVYLFFYNLNQIFRSTYFQEFLGYYHFKSKTHQDEFSPEGLCKAAMFALFVNEQLDSWPEQSTRRRTWLTIPEAAKNCRHPWMREVLEEVFSKWHAEKMLNSSKESHQDSSSSPEQSWLTLGVISTYKQPYQLMQAHIQASSSSCRV